MPAAVLTLSVPVLALSVLFLSLGCLVIWRGETRAARRRELDRLYSESQTDFIDALQLIGHADEAHTLLVRHLERALPHSRAILLLRNRSENQLEPALPLEEGSALAATLDASEPQSCMAIRGGQAYVQDRSTDPLLACEVCCELGAGTCQPLVVGGEIIGSVLVQRDAPLDETDRRRLRESVVAAASVLANIRNLALTQLRAATDALTGLPNARSVGETLNRMVAQTNRTLEPMSVIVLDFDHFTEIGEACGRDKCDEALAAVGSVLREKVRDSDFAGRTGDDEFLVLLPATGPEGAEQVAKKIRGAVAAIRVRGIDRAITVSVGVASLPVHASDGEGLLRIADRALYVAKARGRNRVELAAMPGSGEGATLVALPTLRDVQEDG